jgi:hypothetical protein
MKHKRDARSGNVIIELALVLPLLALVLLGTADFGRLFYETITVQSAARAGVQYGVHKGGTFEDFNGMQQAALREVGNAAGYAAVACSCGWSGRYNCSNNCASQRAYIEVLVTKNSQTVAPYPGIPSQTVLRGVARFRVK